MNDTYCETQNCVDRLLKEYKKHGQLIVAFDFDSTVAPYPSDSGQVTARVWRLLHACEKRKFHIVIYTASTPDRFDMMRAHLTERGITVASINENPFPLPFGDHGKLYFNILLDDRAGLQSACETLEAFFNQLQPD